MNSTVQCLYRVPELRQTLAAYPVQGVPDASHKLTLATKQLFGVRISAGLESIDEPKAMHTPGRACSGRNI